MQPVKSFLATLTIATFFLSAKVAAMQEQLDEQMPPCPLLHTTVDERSCLGGIGRLLVAASEDRYKPPTTRTKHAKASRRVRKKAVTMAPKEELFSLLLRADLICADPNNRQSSSITYDNLLGASNAICRQWCFKKSRKEARDRLRHLLESFEQKMRADASTNANHDKLDFIPST